MASENLMNIVPLNAFGISGSLTRKEAKTLLSLLDARKDQYGRIIVPDNVDPMDIMGLLSKGFVQSKNQSSFSGASNVLELTKTGKDLLQRIILSEPSSFDKHAANEKLVKIASQCETCDNKNSWLQRAIK